MAAAAVAWVPNKTSGRHAIVPQGGPAGYGEGNAHGKFWGQTALRLQARTYLTPIL